VDVERLLGVIDVDVVSVLGSPWAWTGATVVLAEIAAREVAAAVAT
jgi:hypothetical protein